MISDEGLTLETSAFLPFTVAILSHRRSTTVSLETYPFLRSNIDHILEDCNELFAEDFVDDSIPRSISFGTYLPTEKFLDWRTAIYSGDPTLFEAHLLHQLNRACEIIKSDFFCLFSGQEVDRTHEKVIEEQLQLNVYHHYLGQGKMYLYEKEFTR